MIKVLWGFTMLRNATNLIFAILVSLLILLATFVIVIGSIDGSPIEKICIGLFGISAGSSLILVFLQVFKNAGAITLIISALAAVACGIGLMLGARVLHMFFPAFPNIHDSNIITASMTSSAFYLMLWDRGERIDTDSDGIIDAMRSVICLWPMILLYALVFGLEVMI